MGGLHSRSDTAAEAEGAAMCRRAVGGAEAEGAPRWVEVKMPTESEPAVVVWGDCLETMAGLPSGSVDAVVTDPPYGTKKTPWDDSIDRNIIEECLRVSRGYCVFCYSNTRLWHILGIIHALGRDAWVIAWHKSNAMGFERRFAPQWVPVVCVHSSGLPFWGKDLVTVPIVPQNVGHPTPKPLRLMEWLVVKACPPGGLVLDPFGGSGTTAIAAIREGRRCLLIEKEERYADIAQKRVTEAMGTGLLAGVG